MPRTKTSMDIEPAWGHYGTFAGFWHFIIAIAAAFFGVIYIIIGRRRPWKAAEEARGRSKVLPKTITMTWIIRAVTMMIIACVVVNFHEEKPPGNFIRPFQGLSNQQIRSFLRENPSLPVSLEDLRFFRFSDEHQRLVRCLIVPSLFDQRVTLMFARLHGYSNIEIDPALDKLIDAIDDSSALSFLFFAVVSPSYPLYQTALSVSSESSLDEWFQCFFLLLAFIEAMQFVLFLHEFRLDYVEYGKYPKASLLNAVSSVSKKVFVRFAIVSLLSAFSYRVLWWFTPMPLILLLSNALIFALPAWYAWQAYRSIKHARKYLEVLKNGTTKEQLQQMAEEVEQLQATIQRLQDRISRLQSDIYSLKVDIEMKKKEIKDFKEPIQALKASIEILEKELVSAAPSSAEFGKLTKAELTNILQSKKEALKTLKKNLEDHKQQLEKIEAAKRALEIEKDEYLKQVKGHEQGMMQNPAFHELICILRTKTIRIDRLDFIKALGKGGCGAVYEAQMYGMNVAVKMSLATSEDQARDALMLEVSILNQLKHPNIISIIGCVESQGSASPCKKIAEKFGVARYLPAVVLELADGGDLSSYYKREKLIKWSDRYDFALQLAKGLEYLHKQDPPVIHNDIKDTNVLVFNVGSKIVVKFTDFGISGRNRARHSGSLGWMAPEISPILDNAGEHNKQTDVYSFGLMLYFIYTGKVDIEYQSDVVRIKKAGFLPVPSIPSGELPCNCDTAPRDEMAVFKQIMSKCVETRPSARPSMADVRAALEGKRALK